MVSFRLFEHMPEFLCCSLSRVLSRIFKTLFKSAYLIERGYRISRLGFIYDVIYTIHPIILWAMLKIRERFMLEASLGYSPIVGALVDDHHLLLSKVNKGECVGMATMCSLKATYAFTPVLALGMQYDLLNIDTEGTQSQHAPGFAATIDQHIESWQNCLGINLGYAF